MDDWKTQLTKLFKERENVALTEIAVAKVIDIMPDIKLSLSDDIILDVDDLVIASRMYEIELQAGDSVIVMPTASGQIYYLLDKVGEPHVS
ncbi:hypothetical protein G5B47_02520 [Paenibacillus sp. 7124]|uniref:Uncharacterized protein n=1 Tax=Paenibacillus apii TaxID=1850370 RepID=A0A6M1PFL4_9BACL|nr:DUF2577 family protein [Paenibacillus apii]NGM81282.1 hypothetical protein [Paenibacillus apii]